MPKDYATLNLTVPIVITLLLAAATSKAAEVQFQRVMMSTGLSKIELFTLQIASAMAANHSEKYLPETIAEEAYAVALATFEKLEVLHQHHSIMTMLNMVQCYHILRHLMKV